ncbi:chemotaxis protein CheD [Rheinheimera texasensis]|uniref:chemotaxis protein CheD n=1 Tax=Rheinheimera texasensis TaxID=306205 RepID=UPI0004E236E9|nr:chemotaxis protein CheD [Rheinheimera texasensis]
MTAPAQLIDILLQPGDFYFSTDRNTRIRTLLGSCVSVTFWHPKLKLGGMSHFLLPERKTKHTAATTPHLDARYANECFQLFSRELKQLSLPASQFQTKIFGGAYMFDHATNAAGIGQMNILAARQGLTGMGLHALSEHVGGQGHRNVIFELWSGDVWVRQVTNHR